MSIPADDPTLATLRRAALEAIEVLRSVMKAAIAPKPDGSLTNPNQARLAASQLLTLAARFLPRAPTEPAHSPATSSTKPLASKPFITKSRPIIAGSTASAHRAQSPQPFLSPHASGHAGPPRS